MEKIILITLGNRDLQLKKSIQEKQNQLEKTWLEPNNDDKDLLIVKKNLGFYEITSKIYNSFEKWKDDFVFTMIEKSLSSIQANPQNTKILFCATHQNPYDKQDTYYVALIAQKFFESKGYCCECNFIECNPTLFSDLVNHFLKVYESIPKDSNVIISNSGGTPDIRSATYFAGIFRNYNFLNINARTNEPNTQNFKNQEKIILKNIIQQMLQVYDYQGINFLPLSDHIKNTAKEALNYYNLNKEIKGNYGEKSKFAINLLIQTAYVCYVQGRYAEALGRIYRIEEAIWHFLFYTFLKNQGIIDDNDKIFYKFKDKKMELLFKQFTLLNDVLLLHFPKDFEKIGNAVKLKNSDISTQSGKNFYYHFFKHFKVFPEFRSFFEKINLNDKNEPYKNDSVLNDTRNKSYLGHGFKGITKKDLEKIFEGFNGYLDFLEDLSSLLKSEIQNYDDDKIFDKKNEQIMEYLEKNFQD